MQLTEDQKNGILIGKKRYKDGEPFTCIAGYAGCGKAQPIDTLIPLPEGGHKRMGELREGDFVLDRKGLPTKITGVFPQGKLPVWEVSLADGRKTRCNIEHLWSVRINGSDTFETMSTQQIIDIGVLNIFNEPQIFIPLSEKIDYSISQPIDPDFEAYDRAAMWFVECQRAKSQKVPIMNAVKYGSTKTRIDFIRKIYQLKQNENNQLYLASYNRETLEELQDLLLSLGYAPVLRSFSSYEFLYELECYIPNLNTWYPDTKKPREVGITSIKPINEEAEMVCISVDNEESLYLSEHFITTHNTTLVKFLIEELNIPKSKITYAAFTGKAALVLRRHGHNAITLHKLLYDTKPTLKGGFVHIPKRELDEDYQLIVVDEASMVPEHMWDLLLSHGVHVVAIGDQGQLPVVSGKNIEILKTPHVMLSQIMRQALDSEIIRLSMEIRQGKELTPYNGNDVKVIKREELVGGMYSWADQILCASNNTRRTINFQMKQLIGSGEEPSVGDKIICLRNYWRKFNKSGDVLVNGSIGHIKSLFLGEDSGILGKPMYMDFSPNYMKDVKRNHFEDLKTDYQIFSTGVPSQMESNAKSGNFLMQFDYGWAITVWKSQGDSWPKVLLNAEKLRNLGNENYKRYLYTGITRAEEKLVIVLP